MRWRRGGVCGLDEVVRSAFRQLGEREAGAGGGMSENNHVLEDGSKVVSGLNKGLSSTDIWDMPVL